MISIESTERSADGDAYRQFRERVEIHDNGIGFTTSGLFIPPELVASTRMSSGDEVEGIAAVNFDKKKNAWGWKAINTR